MTAEPDREEWFRLFGGLSDDTLTAADHARLEQILSASGAARQCWFLYCDMERGLAGRKSAAALEAPNVVRLPAAPTRRFFRKPWAWAAAAGFALAATVTALMFSTLPTASAAAVVQRALKAHAAALDRCYRVGGKIESARETRLWTRGDRFWIESRAGGKSAAWGRDEQGRVWFTVSPEVGARFDADEVPERLAEICELRSLQVESLLRSLLADFDLRREPNADGALVVHAELKAGHEHPRYRAALLESDSASGVLRRVEVQRIAAGRAPVAVTFTLVEAGLHDDASYTLAGHLSEGPVIYDRQSGLGTRGRALADFLALLWGRSGSESSSLPPR